MPDLGTARRPLVAVLDVADRVLRVLLTVMFAVMLGATVLQVVARYVFKVSIIGPEEIARYMMVASTFLAIPVLARSRNHIAVDALRHYVPSGAPEAWLSRLVLAVECAFLAVFTWYAWSYTATVHATGQESVGLSVPLSWPTVALPIGSALGLLVTVGMLVLSFGPEDQRPRAAPGASAPGGVAA